MTTLEGEKEKVLKWRYRQLRRAGYDKISASLLASSEADLHKAEALAKCPDHHLVVKILT